MAAEPWWESPGDIIAFAAELASLDLWTESVQAAFFRDPAALQPEWDHFDAVGDLKFFAECPS